LICVDEIEKVAAAFVVLAIGFLLQPVGAVAQLERAADLLLSELANRISVIGSYFLK
jgi:hypothetical protein